VSRETLPPHDAKTTDVNKIYQIKNIVSEDALETLTAQVRLLLKEAKGEGDFKHLDYPDFVLNRLKVLGKIEDKKSKTRMAQAMVYLTLLMQIAKLPKLGFEKEMEAMELPKPIKEHVTELFTSPLAGQSKHGHTMVNSKRLHCYIAVASLLASGPGCKVQKEGMISLSRFLCISLSSLAAYFKHVGCKADFSSAELMAPFTPPETPASVQVAYAPDVISSSPLISSVGPSTNTPGPGPVLSKQRVSSSTVTGSATSISFPTPGTDPYQAHCRS
jgi:hypothetical protein